ncbi:MAG: Gfo/Idh/MocA family oxidoreductase [Hyphomicrobiales bacterium]|nr:Gfo/Idh/MocA family oxidoreductase [Hyphomicrobiales bacterium]
MIGGRRRNQSDSPASLGTVRPHKTDARRGRTDVANHPTARIGLIGAGFMGRCHANAFRTAGGLFDLPAAIELACLADATEETAAANARQFGFSRSTGVWRDLTSDPDIDIVAITAPNVLHEPMALDAISHGKTVYCEKPLSTSLESANRMTSAVETAGATTLVGFNFLRNPLLKCARQMIDAGELGEITAFRGRHAENYMATGEEAHSFRTDPEGGGALDDLGSHIISLARYLVGPIGEVSATLKTVYPERPASNGSSEMRAVDVDDMAHAAIRFANGASGTIEANWAATGRTMDLSFEITGTKGSIHFSQEHMNELHVWTSAGSAGRSGYLKIETGPDHEPYGSFCPAPGHHLGFNDLKVIEVAELIEAHVTGKNGFPDFAEATRVQATIDAAKTSAETRRWQAVD